MSTDFQPILCQRLQELETFHRTQKEPFKARAYKTAFTSIASLPGPITHIDQVKDCKGVGASIREKLEKIFRGESIVPVMDTTAVHIQELTEVWGIGPVKARDLVVQHHIAGLEDLRKKENLALLTTAQKIGVRYFEDIQQRIPYKEMEKHEAHLRALLPKEIFTITGSYRRKAANSGDIDVLIKTETPKATLDRWVEVLRAQRYVTEELACGEKKMMGMARLPRHKWHRRLDLLVVHPRHYAFALLYFTGSDEFNVAIRNRAITQGLSLNEYGFTATEEDPPLYVQEKVDAVYDTEEAILHALGIPYVPPPARTLQTYQSLTLTETRTQ